MATVKPRSLSLLAAGALCLSSYLAIHLIVPNWDDVRGQVRLLLSFLSLYGYAAILLELVAAHTAFEGSNARLAAAHTRLQAYRAHEHHISGNLARNRIALDVH